MTTPEALYELAVAVLDKWHDGSRERKARDIVSAVFPLESDESVTLMAPTGLAAKALRERYPPVPSAPRQNPVILLVDSTMRAAVLQRDHDLQHVLVRSFRSSPAGYRASALIIDLGGKTMGRGEFDERLADWVLRLEPGAKKRVTIL